MTTNIFAQTEVSGQQSGNWSVNNSPYLVVGDIVVASGQSLNIEAGVEVNFQGHFKLTVNGNLQAIGTESDSIIFTTDDPATGWHGIRLTESQNGSVFAYCRIEYGKTSGSNYPGQHGGAIMMYNSDALIENCVFANNEATAEDNGMGGAIYGFNTTSNSQISNCLFVNNHAYGEGGAIKLSGDNGMKIERCRFFGNTVLYGGGGICLYGCYDTDISRSLFVGNVTSYSSGGAVFVEGYSARVRITNCTIFDNHATNGDGGAVDIAFSDMSFTNSIIYNNPGAYSDNIYLDFGYAEVNYCSTPFPDGAEGANNINVDAQFVDAPNGDFNLLVSSPCIDAGIDSLTIETAFGETITVVDMEPAEYVGDAPDMGCYEYGMITGMAEPELSNLLFYPNPTKGQIQFKTGNAVIREITITDLSGNTVFKEPVINKNQRIDLSGFENGIYLIIIQTDKGTVARKIVKVF